MEGGSTDGCLWIIEVVPNRLYVGLWICVK
jgi:hypothetical protein